MGYVKVTNYKQLNAPEEGVLLKYKEINFILLKRENGIIMKKFRILTGSIVVFLLLYYV
jgi:hypothetical protein